MEIQTLREKIKSLDPTAHKSLRDALTSRYKRLAGEKEEAEPPSEPAPDSFAEAFEKTVDEINKRYIEGTDDYIRKFHPDLYQEINKAEDKLNEAWRAGLQGKAEIKEFREVLKQWFRLHLGSIEIYSREHKKEEAHLNEE